MLALKDPGSILLISCYELGHQPLGIALPLGFLKQSGYQPIGMDISVEPFDPEKVCSAKFVGISVPMHTALRLGIRVAERVREINPVCHICFYGLYASLNAEYLLTHDADSVIGGEYETPMLHLIASLEKEEDQDMRGVNRLGQTEGPYLERLSFESADREGLPPLEKYARLQANGTERVVGYTEASRGCHHMCRHCPIPPVYQGRFFVIPKETVLEDIRRQVRAGARHITFGDPDFLNGPGHSLKIVELMHEEFPEVTFDITTKVEHILKHRGCFNELRALGCLFVVSAIESLSDTVLTHLNKGHTRADVYTALLILREARIALRPSLVAFTPWTTLGDYQELLNFVESEKLIDFIDPVQYSIRLLIPPGSLLISLPAMGPHLGSLIQESFTYTWTHPDPRMDRLQRDITARVEKAASLGQDPFVTFYQIRLLTDAPLGRTSKRPLPSPNPNRIRPPRLTETWFCCAEPTQGQLDPLQKPLRNLENGQFESTVRFAER